MRFSSRQKALWEYFGAAYKRTAYPKNRNAVKKRETTRKCFYVKGHIICPFHQYNRSLGLPRILLTDAPRCLVFHHGSKYRGNNMAGAQIIALEEHIYFMQEMRYLAAISVTEMGKVAPQTAAVQ